MDVLLSEGRYACDRCGRPVDEKAGFWTYVDPSGWALWPLCDSCTPLHLMEDLEDLMSYVDSSCRSSREDFGETLTEWKSEFGEVMARLVVPAPLQEMLQEAERLARSRRRPLRRSARGE